MALVYYLFVWRVLHFQMEICWNLPIIFCVFIIFGIVTQVRLHCLILLLEAFWYYKVSLFFSIVVHYGSNRHDWIWLDYRWICVIFWMLQMGPPNNLWPSMKDLKLTPLSLHWGGGLYGSSLLMQIGSFIVD